MCENPKDRAVSSQTIVVVVHTRSHAQCEVSGRLKLATD